MYAHSFSKKLCFALSIMTLGSALADTWTSNTTLGNPIRTSTATTKVGIGITGTNTVRNMLDVEGAAVIGSSYSGTNTAPSNGLLVQGNVGIGTSSPKRRLDVSGTFRATSIEGVMNAVFPVTSYGAVANNNSVATRDANNTAFTNALTAAANARGGTVFVPAGRFHINGNLTIPRGVTLKGTWETPHDANLNQGSVLDIYAGRGQVNGPGFLNMSSDAAVMGLTLHYPDQNSRSPTGIQPYPFTIIGLPAVLESDHGDFDIVNVTFANSYQGIYFGNWHERHYIRNVNMTVFSRGLIVDNCTDIGRLENFHIHNRFWWTVMNFTEAERLSLETYTRANLIGFLIAYSDWEQMVDCFVIWAQTGILLQEGSQFTTWPRRLPSVQLVNGGIDQCQIAVFVSRTNPFAGLRISNSQILGRFDIAPTNEGPILIENTFFSDGYEGQNYMITKNGKSTLSLSNCSFFHWSATNPTIGTIEANEGATLISNCDFRERIDSPDTIKARKQVRAQYLADVSIVSTRLRETDLTENAAPGSATLTKSMIIVR